MIGVLTDPGIGGTFLCWSIHYLRGDSDYFLAEQMTKVKLTNNPLSDINAHNFIPNQPNRGADRGVKKLYEMCSWLQTTADDAIVYLHNFDDKVATIEGVNYLCSNVDKLILVSSKKYPLYHRRYHPRSGGNWIAPGVWTTDSEEIYQHLVEKFFKESAVKFEDLKSNCVWDKREFIALNFDPYNRPCIEDCFDYTNDHYFIDVEELYNVENHIIDIFNYLDYKPDSERFKAWQPIYHQWRKLHQPGMKFFIYFDKIIEYIINGYAMDLSRFNLDIVQEATLQHELIYKHNLNLKTWQLEKFTNTKQLHQLLEPNIHDLSKSKISSTAVQ